jgi:hypothetical protein
MVAIKELRALLSSRAKEEAARKEVEIDDEQKQKNKQTKKNFFLNFY